MKGMIHGWVLLSFLLAAGCGSDEGAKPKPKQATADVIDEVDPEDDNAKPSAVKITIDPTAATLLNGDSQTFTATVKNADDKSVTWTVSEGAAGGSITKAGVYTSPLVPGTYHVVAASVAAPSKKATATVTVYEVNLSLNYAALMLYPGASTSFVASVTGSFNDAVVWTATGGSIASDGTYTAPLLAGTYYVVGTSVADPRKSVRIPVTVPIVLDSALGATPVVYMGDTVTFTVSVYGASDTSVTWVLLGTDSGVLSASGEYSAPTTPGTYTIQAISNEDPDRIFTFSVVVPAISITVTPTMAEAITGGTLALSASVYGSHVTGIVWEAPGAPTGGTVSADGVYSAPTTEGTYLVIATLYGTGVTTPIWVTVTQVSLEIVPAATTVYITETFQFSAAVTGAAGNNAVVWETLDSDGGSISANGLYSAPVTPGSYTIRATSVANPFKSAIAVIDVPSPSISLSGDTLVYAGESTAYSAVVSNSNLGFTWSINQGTLGGTITNDGAYTASFVPGTYTLTARSIADPGLFDTIQVVIPEILISVSPATTLIEVSQTGSFTATVSNHSNTNYVWTILEGSAGGSIDGAGNYTAPVTPGTYHVVAISMVDLISSGSATVVVPQVTVTTNVSAATVFITESQTFSAAVSYTTTGNVGFAWSIEQGAAGGTIDTDGVYTAPVTPGVYQVVATSLEESAARSVITVTVPSVIVTANAEFDVVLPGESATYSATVSNTNTPGVVWSIEEGAQGGTITQDGVYTAPLAPGAYHVVATSVKDGSAFDIITVGVPSVLVTANVDSATVYQAEVQTFSAMVSYAADTSVVWSIQEAPGGGSITQGGVYTAPSVAGTYHIVITSNDDNTKSDTITVTVPTVTIVANTNAATVFVTEALAFSAAVSGSSNTGKTWSVQESDGGSVTAGGVYTAPITPGTYHVVATSDFSGSIQDSVTITVPAVTVTANTDAATLFVTDSQTFSAVVSNSNNLAVVWSVEQGGAGGFITQGGVYTAPITAGTYHINVTHTLTGVMDVITITVPAVEVIANTAAATVFAADSRTFTAVISNVTNQTLVWSIQEGAAGGAITQGGIYTAPLTAGTYHVEVGSLVDSGTSDVITITVPAVMIAANVDSATVYITESSTFTASVTNATNTTVVWSVTGGSDNGSITTGGVYTAPVTPGTYTVVASSELKPGVTDSITITVPTVLVTAGLNNATVYAGATSTFTASVSNTNTMDVEWSVLEGASGGTITGAGVYAAPVTGGLYHVVVQSVIDPNATDVIEVLVPSVEVNTDVASATVYVTETLGFSAQVSFAADTSVVWTVLEANGGSVSTIGLYTAPITPGTYHVVASSELDPSAEDTITVTVPAMLITATPDPVTVFITEAQQFAAIISNSTVSTAVWSVEEGSAGGSITAGGLYTAPATAGVYHVFARTNIDSNVYDRVTITVPAVEVTVSPGTFSLIKETSTTFAAVVSNTSNTAVDWTIEEGASGGTITSGGVYTAPVTPGTYTVRATSVKDNTKFGSAIVTVTNIIVNVSPATATVFSTESATFSVAISGTADQSVTWSVAEGATGGSVNGSGDYTSPLTPGIYHVVATSNFDNAITGFATVTVPAILVTVAPNTATMYGTDSSTFTVTVDNTNDPSVTWSVTGGNVNGTVTSGGVYTAPITEGSYELVVYSNVNPARQDAAFITVPAIDVVADQLTATVYAGASSTFTASIYNALDTTIDWSVEEGATGGSVTSGGVYTAPGVGGTYHVIAASAANPLKYDRITITVPDLTVTVSPAVATVFVLESQDFSATVALSAVTTVTWSVQGTDSGSVDSSGNYTAPITPGTYVVVATSTLNTAISDTATITVPVLSVVISPLSQTMFTDTTQLFVGAITNSSTTTVGWTVQGGAANGTVDASGLYRAPATAGTYSLDVYSTVDNSVIDTATITVEKATISISPTSDTVLRNQSTTLSGTVLGTSDTSVTYSVLEGAAGGSVTAGGDYTAPATAGTYHVIATSVADPRQTATATITVPSIVVGVSPTTVSLAGSATQTFTGYVTNAVVSTVTWSVIEVNGGSISGAGLYTAPETSGTYHVRATADEDGTTFAEATVTVNGTAPVYVTVSPATCCLDVNGTQTFTALVTGSATTTVTWSVLEGPAGGTITAGGLYTAPAVNGTFHVIATADANGTSTGSATVKVTKTLTRVNYWNDGADNILYNADDVTATTLGLTGVRPRIQYYYGAALTYTTFSHYSVFDGNGFDFAASNVTAATAVSTGVDAVYGTADDSIVFHRVYYDYAGLQTGYSTRDSGLDLIYGNADDNINLHLISYAGGLVSEIVHYDTAGAIATHDVYTFTGGLITNINTYTGAGTGNQASNETYGYDVSNRLISITKYDLGAQTVTLGRRTFTYTGAETRVATRIVENWVTNRHRTPQEAKNDLRMTYTYTGTNQIPSRILEEKPGNDGIFDAGINANVNVVQGYATGLIDCP